MNSFRTVIAWMDELLLHSEIIGNVSELIPLPPTDTAHCGKVSSMSFPWHFGLINSNEQ